MTGQQLLSEVYRVYRGKIESRTPVWASDKANVAIAIANRKLKEWATDPRNKWNSLFETVAPVEPGTVATTGTTTLTGSSTYFTDYNVGDRITVDGESVRTIDTITSDTSLTVTVAFSNTASGKTFTKSTIIDEAIQTYNLPRTLFLSSDFARVITSSNTSEYPILKAQQRNISNGETTYIHGLNPKKLTFATDINPSIDGGILHVPGYYLPNEISVSTDVVKIDDPNWLVYITASELARNDPAKDDMFPTLVGMANEIYLRMSNANNDVGYAQPNSVVNFMPALGNQEDDWSA